MHFGRVIVVASLLALGACGDADGVPENASTEGNPQRQDTAGPRLRIAPDPGKATAKATPQSCAADIGADAAARRVKICRNVSPATHPPCNAANSCAMIESEIARSCALFSDEPALRGCGSDPRSMQAAADVVRRYYSAINARDYATAWSQWGDDGQPGQTFSAFKKGFAHTRSTRVTIGALKPGDGGAGSVYQSVPVSIDATLDDGSRQRFTGSYIVRRVNDVDGASSWQLRWHIDAAQLRQSPAA